MNIIKRLIVFLFFVTLLIPATAQDFDEIDSLISKKHYKTAAEKLAQYEKLGWERMNCNILLETYKYQQVIADYEDTLWRFIGKLERVKWKFAPPCQNLFYLLLARSYQRFYNKNYYKIAKTTRLDRRPKDIREWSAEDFAQRIDRLYDLALSDETLLKKTKYTYCPSALRKGKLPPSTRPTLYDLIAYYAIDYYMDPTVRATYVLPSIKLRQEKWYLPPEKFARLDIKPYSGQDYNYKILRLYQKLTLFHLYDNNPDALLHTTFERLEFLKKRNGVKFSYEPMRKTLQALMDKYSGTVYEQQAKLKLAYLELEKGDYVTAHRLANEIITYYQTHKEGEVQDITYKNAVLLRNYIERPGLELIAERNVIPDENFPVFIKAKNISRLYYKVVEIDIDTYHMLDKKKAEEQFVVYDSLEPVRSGYIDLPLVRDFKSFSTEYAMQGLKPGFYVILFSNNNDFDTTSQKSIIKFVKIYATYISAFWINPLNSNFVIYKFLNRKTGEELVTSNSPKSTGSISKDRYRTMLVPKNSLTKISFTNTDFSVYGPISLISFPSYYSSNWYDFNERTYCKIFLDRKIYRPGQTAYFKILAYSYDSDTLQLLQNRKLVLSIWAANNKKVKRLELYTDKYGTASGSFVIPQGYLTGRWEISVNYYGHEAFRVEEYKRPTFEIKFTPPKGNIMIGQNIILKGQAISYSGVGLSNATVKYNITASTFYPYKWWYWWYDFYEKEFTVTYGTVKTDNRGNFTIKFNSKNINAKNRWPIAYRVHVTITDINGEAQTKRYIVKAGKQSVYPEVDMPDKITSQQKPVTVFIRNINGQPLSKLKGTLKVYSLVYPADHPLISRKWSAPSKPMYTLEQWRELLPYYAYKDENKLQNLKTGSLILQKTASNNDTVTLSLPPGLYKAVLTVKDPVTGKEVQTVSYTTVYDLNANKPPYPEKLYLLVEKQEIERGEPLRFVVGTGFKDLWLHYRVEERKHVIVDTAIKLSAEQRWITINLDSSVKHGVHITCYLQAQNRFFKQEKTVRIKKPSRKLDFKLETFRDRLKPGQQEEWTVTVLRQRDGRPAEAQVLASMYDASLDIFAKNRWRFATPVPKVFHSIIKPVKNKAFFGTTVYDVPDIWYSKPYPPAGLNFYIPLWKYYSSEFDFVADEVTGEFDMSPDVAVQEKTEQSKRMPPKPTQPNEEQPEIKIRENFAETAFFYPHLHTDEQGRIVIKFTVPESLTRWNFQMFAIDTLFDYGLFFKEVITSQKFSIEPNEPRFLRQGDTLYFTAKVTNLTGSEQTVKASLVFTDATGQDTINIIADRMIKTVKVPPKSSARVTWRVIVPMNLTEAVIYTVKAYNDKVSDGERNILPVLNNRILVTETMPLPVKPYEEKTFVFKHLANYKSNTLSNYRLTLEYNSNPAWYALTAMPYIMEYPFECNEQMFSRFYANSLATYILNSNPSFKRVFEAWQKAGSPGLISSLEKNQELKQVILMETPWVLQGENETENRSRLAWLFDINRMASELENTEARLLERRNPDGGWGWWSGLPTDWFITQYIINGMIKLDSRGVIDLETDQELKSALKQACVVIDRKFNNFYERLKEDYSEEELKKLNRVYPIVVDYLYLRERLKDYDFGLKGNPEAIKFFEEKINRYWVDQPLYTLATEALYFYKKGDTARADSVIRSLYEQSDTDEELGMYWKHNRAGWLWYQAPIETQARIIEAFATITKDTQAIEQMKIWLLKNKQANSWPTTKSTTEAIYALVFYGNDWFADNKQVDITVGKYHLPNTTDKIEAGTGYFKHIWTGNETDRSMAAVRVKNPNNHIAWGAMYWQYFENMDKVVAHQNKELKLSKQYFIERNTDKGKQLQTITEGTSIHVGDIVVVRLVLEADRDMDYVQLKDARPTGFEPVNQLSGYKWKNGLGYYEAPKDASTNFFISHLRPGKYVFEYRLKATIAGSFSTGITTFQCMYAPEFNAHSAGMRIEVKK